MAAVERREKRKARRRGGQRAVPRRLTFRPLLARLLEHDDDAAGGDRVALRHAHLDDGAVDRRLHVQRRLARLDREQRVVGPDGVARPDEDLGDGQRALVADVGNGDLVQAGHGRPQATTASLIVTLPVTSIGRTSVSSTGQCDSTASISLRSSASGAGLLSTVS